MPALKLTGSDRFAEGACFYTDNLSSDRQNRRLVIPVYFGDEDDYSLAIVDTGSQWCILDPRHAATLEAAVTMKSKAEGRVLIRGTWYGGELWRMPIRLVADRGTAVRVDATIFVAEVPEDSDWTLPDFLGLDGFLDRIRFAVDPEENLFYFGALGDA